jgi:CheY-like chemotaxis protein
MKKNSSILLVEDDQVDAMTVKRAFKDLNISNPLHVVHNGEDALDYIRDKKNETPGLVLLDINLPKMNGLEFLRHAKEKGDLGRIPVVVLTSSNTEQDLLDCIGLGVEGYVVKPPDYKLFLDAMKTIYEYWSLNEIPARGV